MPRSRAENIGLDRVGQRCGERVLVILKFCVELEKSVLAQLMIALHQKRAERTLGKQYLATGLVG